MNPYERVSITSTDDAGTSHKNRTPYLNKSTDVRVETQNSEHPYLYIRVPEQKNDLASGGISDYQLPKVDMAKFSRSKMSSPTALPVNQQLFFQKFDTIAVPPPSKLQ